MMPDLIDGPVSYVVRGHLGQWGAHSLVGAVVADVPVTLLVVFVVRVVRRQQMVRLDREALSALVGVVSHILFDLVSHEGTHVLWPFRQDPSWFGPGFYTVWTHVSVPGYRDYPVGPALVMWLLLSVTGGLMFFLLPPRRKAESRNERGGIRVGDTEA
jgi:membrane-bound metal-dependent hydrolase YbcI (DUF457 family)